MKRNGEIIHVEFLTGEMAGEHRYFGSLIAIYEYFAIEDIGISYVPLMRKQIKSYNPYQNKKVIVRRGELHTKPTKRRPPANLFANR